MSDQGTDTFVGVVAVLVVVALVVTAVGGASGTPSGSSTPSASRRPTVGATQAKASSNIPNGPLLGCPGSVIAERTRKDRTVGDLRLLVYYSAANGGRNCAIATRTGSLSRPRGQLVITLRFAGYNGRRWPRLATHRGDNNAQRSGAVYLNNTDNKCVSARAKFTPAGGGKKVWVDTGRVGCG